MSQATASPAFSSAGEPAPPFPSLSSLRRAHGDLLKLQAAHRDTPELIDAIEDFLRRGQETGALLDSPQDRWSAQSVLDYWASALYRLGHRDVDPVLAELDPTLAPALDDQHCPYVGLEAFRPSQHDLFFGRSRLIDEMVSCLRDNRLIAALGSSGSGKSSVVLGGLLPELSSGALPGSRDWLYLPPMVPGSEPLKNLAQLLSPARTDSARLEKDPAQVARLLAERSDQPAVLVIDQFEEVFTLCEDNRARQAFIDALLHLIRTSERRHRVILTMRSDYEPFVARLQELQPLFEQGQLRVTPLSAAELRDAIEKPAERVGLKFEDGVVPALLEDILGEPAGLPLLQFTLLKLWESRERNRITWAAYRRLGGGRLALARSADALYQNLIPEEQVTARRILLRMVQPGGEVTSSRIRRESLYKSGEDPGRIDRVLDKLVQARLVRLTEGETPVDTQVEVAHEALVRNWPQLVEWLEEARTEMATRKRLEARAAEWVRLGRGRGGLLDEVQLLEAERWLASPVAFELGSNEQLTGLMAASRKEVDRAAREKRWRARLRWIAIAIPLLYLAIGAVLQWRTREVEKARAEKKAEVRQLQKAVEEHRREKETLEKEKATLAREMTALLDQTRTAKEAADQAAVTASTADQARREADAAVKNAREREKRAQKALFEALRKEEEAQKHLRDAESRTGEAERKVVEAEEKQADVLNKLALAAGLLYQTEEKQKKLEQQSREASERRDELVADGGGDREETVTGMVKGIQEVVGRRIDLRRFRKNHRPIRLGTSTSTLSEKALPGTICCVVVDKDGQHHLLSRSSVFAGEPGTPIVQPGSSDLWTGRKEAVAEVVRAGPDPNRSGAIARLRDGLRALPEIPNWGSLTGIADRIEAGAEVRLVGRGSGVSAGKVVRIDEDGTIVTDIVPAPGDSGAPLLTPDRRLVGMLWGWSESKEESYVAPILNVLNELDVELVVAVPEKRKPR